MLTKAIQFTILPHTEKYSQEGTLPDVQGGHGKAFFYGR